MCKDKHVCDLRYLREESCELCQKDYVGVRREESTFKRTKVGLHRSVICGLDHNNNKE